MSGYVLQLLGLAGQVNGPNRPGAGDLPCYVARYDPEAHGGRGDVVTTGELAQAAVYPDFEAAFRAWQAVPEAMPRRPDGRINRPLTAFTVEIVPVE